MNSFAATRRSGFTGRSADRIVTALAGLVSALLLTVLLISFEPFAAASLTEGVPAGPNVLNQLGFSGLGALSALGMIMIADRQRTISILDPAWLIIALCLFFSASYAFDPQGATKSVLFTLFVVVASAGVLAIPRSPEQLRQTLLVAVSVVLFASYLGLFLLPEAAIHQAGGGEAQHEGLWRGVFSHKNVAGPVMAAFLFIGVYLMRCGNRLGGLAIVLLSALFVIQTGSKTTNGMVPVAIGVVLAGRIFALRWLPPILCLFSVAIAAAVTVGSVYSPFLTGIVEAVFGDPTYTGRTTLWRFGLENVAANPWFGFGFDSFWLKPIVADSFLPIDADWDYREIVHGHNNFIDIALQMGIPAAAFVTVLLCIRPLFHYARCRPLPENRRLADLLLMILVFVLLNSFLETTWFRRADPTWILTIIAVLGLRTTAILDMESAARRAG